MAGEWQNRREPALNGKFIAYSWPKTRQFGGAMQEISPDS
jgi:hypothetical protein